ncbi:MAG TPA: FG-GAP-like repeat-containing protein [Terriglobales bacterium]|nr:FG-GAP-like repeat-containing protein [Terriglobales bacterium]
MRQSAWQGLLWNRTLFLLLLFGLTSVVGAQNQQTLPASSELEIIVVSSQTEAEGILQRLRSGEDFATLAREKSIDASSDAGGSLGRVDLSTLRYELQEALRAVGPGKFAGPVKIPTGYAILRTFSGAPSGNNSQRSTPNVPPTTGASLPSGSGQGMMPTATLALAGRGKIAYPPDVSGAVEVEIAFRHMPKPPGWDRDLRSICQMRQYSLRRAVGHLEQLLDPNDPDSYVSTKPEQVGQVHFVLAQLLAYQGEMDPAIQHWLEAYKLAQAQAPEMVPEMLEVLGTAYMHKSEMENNVYRQPGDRCLFPPVKPFVFTQKADSEKAVEYFSKYLEQKPDAQEVRWLLNLAYMTLGKYPEGVPANYLIAPSVFESEENVVRFTDIAPSAGLNSFSEAGGVIVDDFDNDGLLDVVTSSFDPCEPLHFFHNNGDGTFTDRALQAGLGDQLGGLNIIQADYNNDGCMDILVLRGGWQFPMRPSLLRNNCDGTFTDVTREAGLAEPMASQTAVWADIDNDGFLDLFIGNEQGPSRLYRNKGDGTFEDISHSAGVDRVAFTKGVIAADYDNDGYMDFYVSNLGGNKFLYHNNHDRSFTEVAAQAGVQQQPWMSFATWFFDYDNDGWPDLFVTSYYMSPEENLRSLLGLPHNVETLKLYHNEHNGTFRDVTAEVGLNRVFNPMGSNFGDIDNDGFLDFYLGTGTPPYGDILPNVLFHNQGGKKFMDVTASSGTGELHKGHGVAFADLDNDGDEDIVAEIGGAVPGDRHAIRLFENPGNGNDWITLKLVGVKSNRAAVGARIKVTVQNQRQAQRSIYRTVGSGGSFGASPLQQHIGLGKDARIVNLEIWWPASQTHQVFNDVHKNQFLEIREGAKDFTRLERAAFHLGAKSAPASEGTPTKRAEKK